MAIAAERKAAERIAPRADDFDEHDEAFLAPHEVMDRLEPIESSDIDRAPRGIIFGTLIGAMIWALIFAVYVLTL